jgi:putative ABC transport system permease protein
MKFALRSLLKSPGYTLIALLTLALGIGVNTSMFSVVNALLFKSAPYPEADRIVVVSGVTRAAPRRYFSEQEMREIRPHTTELFSSLTTLGFSNYTMAESGRTPERIRAITLSEGMSDTFRIQPLLGRAFAADEFTAGKNQVVMLTEDYWVSRFGSDPSVIGRPLRLDGENVTIVGVMPRAFDYKFLWGNIGLIRPLNYTSDQLAYRAYTAFQLIGRLRADVPASRLADVLAPVAADQAKAFPQDYAGMHYRGELLQDAVMDSLGRSISWMLLGLSGFVLLIACANLANLQLARATAAAREFAIRSALGASRWRLVAQQLTESIVVAVAGGLLGILVAQGINTALERALTIDGARGFQVELDARILVITFLVSLFSGAIFGLVPALFASRTDVSSTLKSQSRGSTGGRGHRLVRQSLIVAEIALALVLLGGAAIMNRGFERMLNRPTGWDTERILIGSLPLPESRYDNPKRTTFFREIQAKLATLPGVESVGLSNSSPLYEYGGNTPIFIDAPSAGAAGNNPLAAHVLVTPGYFATLGIRLLEGRNFSEELKFDDPQVIIVNDKLAARFWPNESAIGKRLGVTNNNETTWREVIGVVSHVEPAASLTNPETSFHVYRPFVQEPWSFFWLYVRSPNPAALADSARRAVAELDPDLALDRVGTARQFVERNQHNLIVVGQMLTGFAAVGLALAAVGLYGVISHLVAQRTGEFGIKLALGAQTRDVLAEVLARGLQLAGIGLLIGLVGAWGMGRFLASFMPRLAASDPLAILGVSGLLLVVTLVACLIPARRATKVDPLVALRTE